MGEATNQEDGWVVCRVFKKKNHHKTVDSPNNSCSVTSDAKTQLLHHPGSGDDALDQILQYMGRSCKRESQGTRINDVNPNNANRHLRPIETVLACGLQEMFMKLPGLQSPTVPSLPDTFPLDHSCEDNQTSYGSSAVVHAGASSGNGYCGDPAVGDWAAFDRLLASQLNGPFEEPKPLPCCDDDPCFTFHSSAGYHHGGGGGGGGGGDGDLWSMTRTTSSQSDRISHVSL
ncbi:hypothetical protein BHM03_00052150 [Ensete ventricosum]|nr:hypothetical protein BHM03_00052150 [Ensete ventricosum]